ncbi:hypothetical protein BG61_35405 [Caballeronia glathei]|uniref:Uncharacterized protein n=1 Tax=Caballeronia glathei TaxID=60547 RepID=A0A069PNY1_9BURK|nr:hypothetical protein BG61_35405 [Caballeronia glathei]
MIVSGARPAFGVIGTIRAPYRNAAAGEAAVLIPTDDIGFVDRMELDGSFNRYDSPDLTGDVLRHVTASSEYSLAGNFPNFRLAVAFETQTEARLREGFVESGVVGVHEID